jgi:hypothetical protein
MMIYGMVVPILNPPAQRTAEACGQNIHARFDKASGQKQLLSPSVSPITIPNTRVLPIQIKGNGEECLIEQSINATRFSFKFKTAEKEEYLLQTYLRFMMHRWVMR